MSPPTPARRPIVTSTKGGHIINVVDKKQKPKVKKVKIGNAPNLDLHFARSKERCMSMLDHLPTSAYSGRDISDDGKVKEVIISLTDLIDETDT